MHLQCQKISERQAIPIIDLLIDVAILLRISRLDIEVGIWRKLSQAGYSSASLSVDF
jgi:hypothetical protein